MDTNKVAALVQSWTPATLAHLLLNAEARVDTLTAELDRAKYHIDRLERDRSDQEQWRVAAACRAEQLEKQVEKWERHEMDKASCCWNNEKRVKELEIRNANLEQQLAEAHGDVCENGHDAHELCGEECSCVGSGKSPMERMQAKVWAAEEAYDKLRGQITTLASEDTLNADADHNAFIVQERIRSLKRQIGK